MRSTLCLLMSLTACGGAPSTPDVPTPADETTDGLPTNSDPTYTPQAPCPEGQTLATWFPDGDGDGFGRDADAVLACEAPPAHAPIGRDCDDGDPGVHPAATEDCATDDVDEDCDGLVGNDDAVGAVNAVSSYIDADGDGHGAANAAPTQHCTLPVDRALDNGDCDDSLAEVAPSLLEITCDLLDNDCDPTTEDEPDRDADGHSVCTDCDDANALVHPAAVELTCDGLDNDCDPLTEDDADVDLDGVSFCDGDCDDGNADVGPGVLEVLCDGVDNDCDAATTDDADDDADGTSICAGDCDDRNAGVFPGAVEVACDGADNDCDMATPDRVDLDLDGFSACGADCDDSDPAINPSVSEILCDGIDNDCAPATVDAPDMDSDGFDVCSGDCDDADPARNPGNVEVACDGIDNDCDAITIDATDGDGDGLAACLGDCDDTDPAVHPDLPEVSCDGIDNDCNPATLDDNDRDSDGVTECGGDCDDLDPLANPGETEVSCDGRDNDCDPSTPEDSDADLDGVGFCTDCDDADPTRYPGAAEIFGDGHDASCDGADGIGLYDDFETGDVDAAVWSSVIDAGVETGYAHDSTYSLVIAGSGQVTTRAISAAPCAQAHWSFMGRRGPDGPYLNDLLIEYETPTGWVLSDTWLGDGADSVFFAMGGLIDQPDAMWDGLRLRLTNTGTSDTRDEYTVDDFAFECWEDPDGDGVNSTVDCDIGDGDHWSDCGACIDGDGDGHGPLCDLGIDCDDTDPGVHRDAIDLVGDGLDPNCDGVDGYVFMDDFELDLPQGDPRVWTSITGDFYWETESVWSGDIALRLAGGDSWAETQVFDATGCSELHVGWMGRRGPSPPSDTDYLLIEYLTATGWVNGATLLGNGLTEPVYRPVDFFTTDPLALWNGLKVRLFVDGNATDGDQFLVDDFILECWDDGDGDGVNGSFDCDDADAFHWSDCGLCTDGDGDGYGVLCDLGSDCDDMDSTVNADAQDAPGDGVDANCDGVDGYRFTDDFDSGNANPLTWLSLTGDAEMTDEIVYTGAFSLRLGGDGGVAETQVFDATGCPEVRVGWKGKRGPDAPDVGEDVVVEYLTAGGWISAGRWWGTDDEDIGWGAVDWFINDPGALWSGLQVRLSNNGSSHFFDHFYLDDFVMECWDDADGDGFSAGVDCDPADGEHWSDCGWCVDGDGDAHGVDCDRGGDCDDADPLTYDGAADLPEDGLDNNCDGYDGVVIADDFELGVIDPDVFASTVGNAEVVSDPVHGGSYSLFVGDHAGSVTMVTQDTSDCTDLAFGFAGKRGPDAPYEEAALVVEFWDGTSWVETMRWFGWDYEDPTFSLQWGEIVDPAAFHPEFALRISTLSYVWLTDDFYIDDFVFGCDSLTTDGDGDGVLSPVDCDPGDSAHWFDCGRCVDVDGDGYGLDCDLGPDCDDADSSVNPAAVDILIDGVDLDCDWIDGPPIAFDDFDIGQPDPAMWSIISGDGGIDSAYAYSGGFSLRLSEAPANAVTLPLDTSACAAGVAWSFWGRREIENTDDDDAVQVSWATGGGGGLTYAWPGPGVDADFSQHGGVISDPASSDPSFTFYLAADADWWADDTFLDDITIGCAP